MNILIGDGPRPETKAPECLKCVYFRVTWDPAFPRACDVFGIKTPRMPSWEVFQATGRQCPAFELKKGIH